MSHKGETYNFDRGQFNQRLKNELNKQKEKGISQAEIARRIGIGAGTLSKYRNDDMLPGIDTLSLLAEVFNVSADFLLTGREKKSPKPYRTLRALGVLLQDLEPCISIEEVAEPAGTPQGGDGSHRLALVINDKTIQDLLRKWRLYRTTARTSPADAQELKHSLFNAPLNGLLNDPSLEMIHGHIVNVTERDAFVEDPTGELFLGVARISPTAAVSFVKDGERDNPLRSVKFLPGSAWDLETVDRYADRLQKGEIAPWEYDQMLEDFKEEIDDGKKD